MVLPKSRSGTHMKKGSKNKPVQARKFALSAKQSLVAVVALLTGFVLRTVGDRVGLTAAQARDSSQRTTLLLAQQVDKLASFYLDPLASKESLSATDRDAISSWQMYDREFVSLASSQPDLRFERASTLRRVGYANMLDGKFKETRSALEQSYRIFEELLSQEPASISVKMELAASQTQLAQLSQLEGNYVQALEECSRAINLLDVKNATRSEEYEDAVKFQLAHLARLLLSLDAPDKARELASANVVILERLIGDRGPTPEDEGLLSLSLELLKKAEAAK